MKRCSVCGHVSRIGESNISFHKFPTDENLYKAWCSAVGPNFSPSKTAVICSQHFLDTCLFYYPGGTKQRRYIKKGSIPTIFGLEQSTTHQNKTIEPTIEEIGKDESLKQNVEIITTDKLTELTIEVIATDQSTEQTVEEIVTDETTQQTVKEIAQINVNNQNDCNITSLNISKEIPGNLIKKENNNKEVFNALTVNLSPKKFKNFSPRYVGDYYHNDFGSRIKASKCWSIVLSRVEMQRRKIKTLQQQNRRLRKRLANLKSLLSEITNKYVILKNPEEIQ